MKPNSGLAHTVREPLEPEHEVRPCGQLEPRRVLLELQQNQVDYAHARRQELGLYSLSAFFRQLIAREMEGRHA